MGLKEDLLRAAAYIGATNDSPDDEASISAEEGDRIAGVLRDLAGRVAGVKARHANLGALAQALRSQRQIDDDGTEVGVSRQAADEAATIIEGLAAAGVPVPDTCCGRTMVLGYRCEGCPYAKPGDKLVPRIPQDPNPPNESPLGVALPETPKENDRG